MRNFSPIQFCSHILLAWLLWELGLMSFPWSFHSPTADSLSSDDIENCTMASKNS